MSWRAEAAHVIAGVLQGCEGKTEAEIKSALFDAFPFGQRTHYPYKIWLDEIKRQRGLKQPLYSRTKKVQQEITDKNQGMMFNE